MKLSKIGRISMAFVVSVALGLGMTACGGGTIGYMWVLGTQFNQISAFKIDDFTGNLTATPKTPFTSAGANPVAIAVRSGGRYVYVANAGSATTPGNIAVFSVGGDGTLTFQQSYTSAGNTPIWLTVDSTGNFLYVLDAVSPDNKAIGDITLFAIADATGRLTLIPNQQVKNANGTQLTYFPVGPKPTMMRIGGGSCLFTLDSGDQTIYPYTANSSTGQLTLTVNSSIATGAGNLTSINVGGTYAYLTDATASPASPGGQILPYTVGTGCNLNTLTGGAVNNLALTSNPVYSFTDAKGKFLYVLNASTTNSNNANSTISAYTIDATTGKLQPLGDSNNPYPVGAGPVCMVEDPTSQYVYTSNNTSSTVSGFIINQNTGQLSGLVRGSTFPTSGRPTCLSLSGNVG